MARRGKSVHLSIWYKQSFVTKHSSQLMMDADALVIGFIESVVNSNGLRNVTSKDPRVWLKGLVKYLPNPDQGKLIQSIKKTKIRKTLEKKIF